MNRQGFSILESVVSSGILAIAIMGANMQYIQQMKAQGSMNVTGKARAVMNQSVAEVISNPNNYPNISNGMLSSTYVLCYDANGASFANSYTLSSTPVGVFMANRTDFATNAGVSLCNNANSNLGGYESHLTWVTPSQIEILTLILPQPGRPFKTINAVKTVIDL